MKIDEIDFKCQGCGACCRIKDGTRVVVDMVLYHLKALVAEGIAKLRQYASCLARATPSTVLCQ